MNYVIFLGLWFFILCGYTNTLQIETVEKGLNAIASLEARFIQTDSVGNSYKGTLFLKRPWKMRMEYDAPSPFLIVSDGQSLIYEDHTTFEATYLPLEASPLAFLISDKTNLKDTFQVDHVQEKDDLITIVCHDKKNYFSLTLIFSKKQKSILGWISKDAQGNEIKIQLQSIQCNVPLQEKVFRFQQKPRWLVKSKERK